MSQAGSVLWSSMYDPPYESLLEDAFAWGLSKVLSPGTILEKQVEVKTICGDFRLDFVATAVAGRQVAYECDGAEFHEQQRDEWRDAMILGANAVDSIIRLRGSDLTYHLDDVLWLLSKWDPDMFSDRSQKILFQLASDRARYHRHDCLGSAMITYWEESKSRDNPLHIFLRGVIATFQRVSGSSGNLHLHLHTPPVAAVWTEFLHDGDRRVDCQPASAAEPTAEADRGRHPGLPSFYVLTGGPGSLALVCRRAQGRHGTRGQLQEPSRWRGNCADC